MAKSKFKKYPKKPKASASLETHKRWLEKVKDVDRYNAQIKKDAQTKAAIRKKIAGIGRAKY